MRTEVVPTAMMCPRLARRCSSVLRETEMSSACISCPPMSSALTGRKVPATGITIAKRPMRGVDSEGMICSKEELEIQEDLDQHWIWNL